MAVTWSFKDAGLVCAVCADLAGLIIVKSGRGSSAAFAEGKGSSTVRKAVSSYVKPNIDEDLDVLWMTLKCLLRYKVQPCGPTNRAAVAAGRRGSARRWGERPAGRP